MSENTEYDDEMDEKLIEEEVFACAVEEFIDDPCDSTADNLVNFLSEYTVWIPFVAVFSENDQNQVLKMIEESRGDLSRIVGMTFTSQDDVHLKPDLLKNDDGELYLPVFTGENVMDEYKEGYSKMPMEFVSVIDFAEGFSENELTGVVLNAFTTPLEIPMENLKRMKMPLGEARCSHFAKSHGFYEMKFYGETDEFVYYDAKEDPYPGQVTGVPTMIMENKRDHSFDFCSSDQVFEAWDMFK